MLRPGGLHWGTRILSEDSVAAMTTDQLGGAVGPGPSGVQGWGFGVGVQRGAAPPRSAGTYGWDGGLGSSWATDPAEDLLGILLTNEMWSSPDPPPVVDAYWEAAHRE